MTEVLKSGDWSGGRGGGEHDLTYLCTVHLASSNHTRICHTDDNVVATRSCTLRTCDSPMQLRSSLLKREGTGFNSITAENNKQNKILR